MKVKFLCMCNHEHGDHVIEEAGGFNVCQIEDCSCKCYDAYSMDKIYRMMNHMEKLMTMVDVDRMEWQGHLDMAALAGVGMMTHEAEPLLEDVALSVKRVPLVRYEGRKRIVIGVADVDENSGVVKAEVNPEFGDIFAIPGMYSIHDGEPPTYDHTAIKEQLRGLSESYLYANPFKIQGVTAPFPRVHLDEMQLKPIPAERSLKEVLRGAVKKQQEEELQNLDDDGFFDFLKDAGRISGAKWRNTND